VKLEDKSCLNIQGTNPVGSMVVFVNGTARNDLYRKFKINRLKTPNDYLMHQEMMERRINKFLKSKDKDESNKYTADESFDTLPSLMIIDGGKGQLSSINEILVKYNLTDIPHIGLAKREEEIFYLKDGEFLRVKLPKKSEALFLIQRIRDETHRFGITYHRKLRSKKFLNPDL
jgi:excinuclease ABC subunit C